MSSGDKLKLSVGAEGYANEADRGILCASVEDGEGDGNVFWVDRDGRVKLVKKLENENGRMAKIGWEEAASKEAIVTDEPKDL